MGNELGKSRVNEQKLMAKIRAIEAEKLDDIVHDAASQMASNANNGGVSKQIEFLIAVAGWTVEEIHNALNFGEEQE